jgi:predicted nucleotide-binding protein (sugar kinase/HSP70/actin superfamily)
VHPLIRFRGGPAALSGPLHDALRLYGVGRREITPALAAGEAALAEFRHRIRTAGTLALTTLARTREPAIVLVGRPYNLFDPVVNLDIPRKLRDLYGVNVLPLEFLAADDQAIDEINQNMFWSYGRRILAACREAARHSDLHLIYITNFKCGPDSYIKHFVRDAFGRAFLTLQFDGHANDAGMLTRVEAYLDSQGFLRRPRPAPWAAGVTFADETADAREAELDGAPSETPEPVPPRPPRTKRPPVPHEVDTR